MICDYCAGSFGGRRPAQRYCSARCRWAQWARAHPRTPVRGCSRGAVLAVLLDGRERTLAQIAAELHCRESTAGSKLRELRMLRYGAWKIDGRTVVDGRGRPKIYRLLTPGRK